MQTAIKKPWLVYFMEPFFVAALSLLLTRIADDGDFLAPLSAY